MDIQVRGNGVIIDESLRDFIDRRAAKLDHLVGRVTDAKLELRGIHNRIGPDATSAQITIRSGQETIRVAPIEPDSAFVADDDLDDDERVGDLVRTKRFDLKPMDVAEAIEQMELLGHDFFLFHYADEDVPSVVYRRRDGAYGLLIPSGA